MKNIKSGPGIYIDGYPAINLRRVRGFNFTPYSAKHREWAIAANRILANMARANFERAR